MVRNLRLITKILRNMLNNKVERFRSLKILDTCDNLFPGTQRNKLAALSFLEHIKKNIPVDWIICNTVRNCKEVFKIIKNIFSIYLFKTWKRIEREFLIWRVELFENHVKVEFTEILEKRKCFFETVCFCGAGLVKIICENLKLVFNILMKLCKRNSFCEFKNFLFIKLIKKSNLIFRKNEIYNLSFENSRVLSISEICLSRRNSLVQIKNQLTEWSKHFAWWRTVKAVILCFRNCLCQILEAAFLF